MTTTTTAPQRQKALEGTRLVADRLGVSTEMLREIARESGIYLQRKPTSPMMWTAALEAQLVEYIETRYAGSAAATPTAGEDPFA